jgi:uncharacterized protein (TIGR00251 family)
MIQVTSHPEGCVLPVKAQPGARKNGIIGEHAGALKVAVTAPPEDGRANKALIETLSRAIGIRRSQIELLTGLTSREKRFLIREMQPSALLAALDRLSTV